MARVAQSRNDSNGRAVNGQQNFKLSKPTASKRRRSAKTIRAFATASELIDMAALLAIGFGARIRATVLAYRSLRLKRFRAINTFRHALPGGDDGLSTFTTKSAPGNRVANRS
jgi:hypothetical protein